MADRLLVYIGTYTTHQSKGIYSLVLDLSTGAITQPVLAAQASDPTFLAVHPNRRFLYAAERLKPSGQGASGIISAFAIDNTSGLLRPLNRQSSGGDGPCHLTVDKDGKNVLVAHYSSGRLSVLPIGQDGLLGELTQMIQHPTIEALPKVKQPHAHSITLDPSGRFAFAADLGLDQILVYRFDADRGKLIANDPPAVSVRTGAGPRHFAFHPNGQFAYVINELASTITAFSYDADRGILSELQDISTLPAGFVGTNSTAEIQVHPSGRFLYGSNRGHDSIAVFAVNAGKGTLTAIEHVPTQGRTPRNIGIDPTGKYLLAANEDTNTLVVFCIDPATGRLRPTGFKTQVPTPVCIKFIPKLDQS